MRKFYKNSAIIILTGVIVFLSIGMPIFFIYDYENYDYSKDEEAVVGGLEGLKLRKQQIKKVEGILTIDELNQALILYKSFPLGSKAYYKVEDQYPGLFQLLREAYSPYAEENNFVVNNISNADDFYEKSAQKVKSKMEAFGEGYFSQKEIEEALHRVDEIDKPFLLKFVDQWAILIKSLIFVYSGIVFLAIIISSQIFSYEKEKNMDIILKATGKRKLLKVGYKKSLAMIWYLVIQFFLSNVIVAGIVFGLLGISGWNSQLQIMPDFFTVIYNWTFGEAYIIFMSISGICILSIALIGAFINAIFQRTYTSLIILILIIIPPMFLKNNSFLPRTIERLFMIQPINGINLLGYIDSLFNYKIGVFQILSATTILYLAIGYFIVFFILSPYIFEKRINI